MFASIFTKANQDAKQAEEENENNKEFSDNDEEYNEEDSESDDYEVVFLFLSLLFLPQLTPSHSVVPHGFR